MLGVVMAILFVEAYRGISGPAIVPGAARASIKPRPTPSGVTVPTCGKAVRDTNRGAGHGG
jgi:hypothetical protein